MEEFCSSWTVNLFIRGNHPFESSGWRLKRVCSWVLQEVASRKKKRKDPLAARIMIDLDAELPHVETETLPKVSKASAANELTPKTPVKPAAKRRKSSPLQAPAAALHGNEFRSCKAEEDPSEENADSRAESTDGGGTEGQEAGDEDTDVEDESERPASVTSKVPRSLCKTALPTKGPPVESPTSAPNPSSNPVQANRTAQTAQSERLQNAELGGDLKQDPSRRPSFSATGKSPADTCEPEGPASEPRRAQQQAAPLSNPLQSPGVPANSKPISNTLQQPPNLLPLHKPPLDLGRESEASWDAVGTTVAVPPSRTNAVEPHSGSQIRPPPVLANSPLMPNETPPFQSQSVLGPAKTVSEPVDARSQPRRHPLETIPSQSKPQHAGKQPRSPAAKAVSDDLSWLPEPDFTELDALILAHQASKETFRQEEERRRRAAEIELAQERTFAGNNWTGGVAADVSRRGGVVQGQERGGEGHGWGDGEPDMANQWGWETEEPERDVGDWNTQRRGASQRFVGTGVGTSGQGEGLFRTERVENEGAQADVPQANPLQNGFGKAGKRMPLEAVWPPEPDLEEDTPQKGEGGGRSPRKKRRVVESDSESEEEFELPASSKRDPPKSGRKPTVQAKKNPPQSDTKPAPASTSRRGAPASERKAAAKRTPKPCILDSDTDDDVSDDVGGSEKKVRGKGAGSEDLKERVLRTIGKGSGRKPKRLGKPDPGFEEGSGAGLGEDRVEEALERLRRRVADEGQIVHVESQPAQ